MNNNKSNNLLFSIKSSKSFSFVMVYTLINQYPLLLMLVFIFLEDSLPYVFRLRKLMNHYTLLLLIQSEEDKNIYLKPSKIKI